MTIQASLSGRLRNTRLPISHSLLPLFEGVVNGIQAIDDASLDPDKGRILIRIARAGQGALPIDESSLGDLNADPITGFSIQDNGEGFHDKNLESFQLLDSEYKSRFGCRGVGRLLWLIAFDRVEIQSTFAADDICKRRTFDFTRDHGVAHDQVEHADGPTGTTVHLIGLRSRYRDAAPKTANSIAKSILEHCLWYFIRPGGAPRILVLDGDQTIDLQDVFSEHIVRSSQSHHIDIDSHKFDIMHLRLRPTSKLIPKINWCAAHRVALEETLKGKIPGLHGKLVENGEEFVYACYVTSDYLDDNVRSERTGFELPEATEDTVFGQTNPGMSQIRSAVLASSKTYLGSILEETQKAGRERVETFVQTRAPRYRSILARIDEEKLSVDPTINDRELEVQLHRHLADIEEELIVDGQYVLNAEVNQGDPQYVKKLREYLEKVDDVKQSDLAGYVSHRRVILDLLSHMIEADSEGKYTREDAIHTLIMPMGTTSSDAPWDASNLWIIDERLAFHNFLASDRPISTMPITESLSRLEPDLLALKLSDTPVLVSDSARQPLASIVVVEIKRPMRNDAGDRVDKDPLLQALRYLEKVREGRVLTASGRPIPESQQIPGFIYVIADLTPTVQERCKSASLRPSQDRMSYFGYNDNYKAYIEVISFGGLLNAAKERNRAFFEKLGLPAT